MHDRYKPNMRELCLEKLDGQFFNRISIHKHQKYIFRNCGEMSDSKYHTDIYHMPQLFRQERFRGWRYKADICSRYDI